MYRCFLATHLPIAKVLQRFEVELVPPDIRNHKFEFSYSELEKKKIRFVYSSTNQSWNKLRGNMPDSRRFLRARFVCLVHKDAIHIPAPGFTPAVSYRWL